MIVPQNFTLLIYKSRVAGGLAVPIGNNYSTRFFAFLYAPASHSKPQTDKVFFIVKLLMFCCVIFGYFSCFICNCLCFRATSLLFVLVQRCFVDSSVHSFINYIDKIIPKAFGCNFFFQSLKITISELYAKHLRSAITLLLSINQTVQISIISPFIYIQNR